MAVAIGAIPESPSPQTTASTRSGLHVVPGGAPLRVVISRVDGETVISPHGDIDSSTSSTLTLALSSLLAEDRPAIILDLTDVATVAADRAWVIGEASRLLTQRGGRLALVGANPDIRHVLEAADLGWLLVDVEPRVLHRRADDDARKGAD